MRNINQVVVHAANTLGAALYGLKTDGEIRDNTVRVLARLSRTIADAHPTLHPQYGELIELSDAYLKRLRTKLKGNTMSVEQKPTPSNGDCLITQLSRAMCVVLGMAGRGAHLTEDAAQSLRDLMHEVNSFPQVAVPNALRKGKTLLERVMEDFAPHAASPEAFIVLSSGAVRVAGNASPALLSPDSDVGVVGVVQPDSPAWLAIHTLLEHLRFRRHDPVQTEDILEAVRTGGIDVDAAAQLINMRVQGHTGVVVPKSKIWFDLRDAPDGDYMIGDEGEECIVRLYVNPDTRERGIGYNTADGGGFVPLSHLNSYAARRVAAL